MSAFRRIVHCNYNKIDKGYFLPSSLVRLFRKRPRRFSLAGIIPAPKNHALMREAFENGEGCRLPRVAVVRVMR